MKAPACEAFDLVDSLVKSGVTPDQAAKTAAEVLGAKVPDRLLSVEEFAPLVHRSERTVREWCQRDDIPCVKVKGEVVGIHFPTFLAQQMRGLKSKGRG